MHPSGVESMSVIRHHYSKYTSFYSIYQGPIHRSSSSSLSTTMLLYILFAFRTFKTIFVLTTIPINTTPI